VTPERSPVFIVHPGAAAGRALARVAAILERAPHLAARSRTEAVRSLDEAHAVVGRLLPHELPVATGGDGTVALVAHALRSAGIGNRPFAVLPTGTGHAFAAAMGVRRTTAALEAIEVGDPRPIDVMVTTHREAPLALVSISAGLESLMLARIGASPHWRRGHRVLAAIARVPFRSSLEIAVTLDDVPLVTAGERAYNAGLYNLPYYGFGWLMWPEADGADGSAEAVACLSSWSYWRTLLRGLRTAQPTHRPTLRAQRWRRAHLEVAGPIQVDGEVVSGGAFDVVVERRAMQVLRPPSGGSATAPPPRPPARSP